MTAGPVRGQVVETIGGAYRVRTPDGVLETTLRGRLKRGSGRDRVVIGDQVVVSDGVIEEVLPRRTSLWRRPSWSRFAKVVAANLDRLIVVASVADPPPSRGGIDRMLVMGEAGDMACQVVLNKVDLPGGRETGAELARAYGEAGYPATQTSVTSGEGIEAFRAVVRVGSSALVGPSGVGKSSLLNAVEPGLSLRTRSVGRRSRSGRHTTVSSRLIDLAGGGAVADTPGFTDAGPGGIDPRALDRCFPEFRPLLGECRFSDCSHMHEPGCAVRTAFSAGDIPRQRYDSYRDVREELESLARR